MLETVLEIGRCFRREGLLEHHRYVRKAPQPDKKLPVTYLNLPVLADGSFDLGDLHEIEDENITRHKLYYLTFKTSDADSSVKYMFGDICYGKDKNGNELGYYQMANKAKRRQSSFFRANGDARHFAGTNVDRFRNEFESKIEAIESELLRHADAQYVFLHFDFDGRQWYELEAEASAINDKLLKEFLTTQQSKLVLQKALFKTLASPDKDVQFPGLSASNIYKARSFIDGDEVLDLLYAIDYSERALIRERSIKIVVLPKGDQLSASEIDAFSKWRPIERQADAEQQISSPVMESLDSLFEPVDKSPPSMTEFDFVFSKAGGVSAPDVDMVEIPGLQRSHLASVGEAVRRLKREIRSERDGNYPRRPKNFIGLDIRQSFSNILGDVTRDQKKYQSHLFKVLPQIFSGTYGKDDLLLPAFVQKTEFNIRNDKPDFNLLKYDYYFLTRLRGGKGESDMEEMSKSLSYQAGKLLGAMARPLGWKINSFDKNYVGLLSRRIADLKGMMKFSNFINEKLTIHGVAYPDLRETSMKLATIMLELKENDYNKNHCAFGFFESYYARIEPGARSAVNTGETGPSETLPNG
jgi:hypothetical protein